jgi:hypothetical protein
VPRRHRPALPAVLRRLRQAAGGPAPLPGATARGPRPRRRRPRRLRARLPSRPAGRRRGPGRRPPALLIVSRARQKPEGRSPWREPSCALCPLSFVLCPLSFVLCPDPPVAHSSSSSGSRPSAVRSGGGGASGPGMA